MAKNSSTANSTLADVPCTLDTCPLSEATITYQPNIAGNAFFLAVFGTLFLAQLGLGIRHKTWSYLGAMLFGLILEVVGYIGRLQLHEDPFNFNFFIEYLVGLTIAPAFLTAAIYITFARVVHCCDEHLAWVRQKRVSIFFMTCDFICLVLQATGGAITSTSGGPSQGAADVRQTGINIMNGGLAFQVASLFSFMLYAAIYLWRWHAATALHYSQRLPAREQMSLRFKGLVLGLAIASVTIFVRCVFRVAELSQGFSSALANNEVTFMILEGTMIILASLSLTFGHPGLCLDIPWRLPKQSSRKRRDVPSSGDSENVHNSK